MIEKVFTTVLFVLTIGVLRCTALTCKRNVDCVVQTPFGKTNGCCYKFLNPPRCMKWCHYFNRSLLPTGYPSYTIPSYNKFTLPVPEYNNKFTLPDFNKFPDSPDYNIPPLEYRPTINFNDNDYYDNNNDEDSGFSPAALIGAVIATVFLSFFIFCLRYLRYRERIVGYRQNCIVHPQAESSSRANIVAQESEQPSRIVIISIREEEENSAHENRPPDGEPPFLSEEDILHNTLHNVSVLEPPPYEENPRTEAHHPPNYEDIFNRSDQPPPFEYGTGQETLSLPVQQNLPIPEVSPPRYEEVQTGS